MPHREVTPMNSKTSATNSNGSRVSLRGEVARRIDLYKPRSMPQAEWTELRPFVVRSLYAAEPVGLPAMERFARVLTLIAAWCVNDGIPLDAEMVLDPDTVERFCSNGLKRLPSWGSYRATLRYLGPRLTTKAPWEPRPKPMPARRTAVPYTQAEMRILRTNAERQSSPRRQRSARGLMALGAGVGLDGRWNKNVRGTDVERLTDGTVIVHVSGKAARDVVVLKTYEEELLDLAEAAGDDYIVGGKTTNRNRSNELSQRFESGHQHLKLEPARLRATWVVTHLAMGTRLPELLAAAGTSRIETFDALLAYVPPLDARPARRLMQGRP